jgi:hypothetical protein
MVENFLIVATQVVVLFVLIFIGMICGKAKLINDNGAKHLTDIVLYLATPCIMIKSFQDVKYESSLLVNLGVAALCSMIILVCSIFLCRLIFRDKDESRRKVLQFATVFSNCGFMSLPLQNAVLGSKGVFYGSVFVAFFNIIVWSYGLIDMSGNKSDFSAKKLILNPGILGVLVAVLLFFFKITLPTILIEPINYLAGLNTPLPMLIIGYYLSKTDFKKALTDAGVYISMGLRLIAIPLASLFVMALCGVRGDVLVACTIASSAPSAATTTMFSTKFNRDTDLSVGIVSTTSLFSIITMPMIIAIAQTIQ